MPQRCWRLVRQNGPKPHSGIPCVAGGGCCCTAAGLWDTLADGNARTNVGPRSIPMYTVELIMLRYSVGRGAKKPFRCIALESRTQVYTIVAGQ